MRTIILFALLASTFLSCKNAGDTNSGDMNSADSTGFQVSLAEWSFHKEIFAGKMTHLDFITKSGQLGFTGVEYVNQFFKDKAQDTAYLNQMTEAAAKAGVKQVLIMIDGEGYLADLDKAKRDEAIQNHYKWVDAAAYLGCHSIRVNAHGEGTSEQVAEAAVDGLGRLADYAATKNINVIVENHGGYSSDGTWLSSVMAKVNKPNCGTLPDFGNFCLKRSDSPDYGSNCLEEYDRYKGVEELMPYAKAVSAKSHDFDAEGNETHTDYMRMLDIVKAAGYRGFIGVEYEGEKMGEEAGIVATKNLIEKWINKAE